jgi:ABC-type siderophore export system fused ATPase/permease subunit
MPRRIRLDPDNWDEVARNVSHKRKGQLVVLGEWARHLRPRLRRVFWKKERAAEKAMLRNDTVDTADRRFDEADRSDEKSGIDV